MSAARGDVLPSLFVPLFLLYVWEKLNFSSLCNPEARISPGDEQQQQQRRRLFFSVGAGDDGLGGASKAERVGPDPYPLLLTPNPPPPTTTTTPTRSVHALCLFLPAGIKHMPVTRLLPAPAAMLSSFLLLALSLRVGRRLWLQMSNWAGPAGTVGTAQELRLCVSVVLALACFGRYTVSVTRQPIQT